MRAKRAKIGAALAAACVIDHAGMGADVLGRLRYVLTTTSDCRDTFMCCCSNRASRAAKIDTSSLPPMSSLDLANAPEEECLVMLEDGPAALLVRAVPSEIAEDSAWQPSK